MKCENYFLRSIDIISFFVVFFQEWESSALMLESSFSEVKTRNTGNLASNENEEAINFYP